MTNDAHDLLDAQDLVDRYVAVWNEPDPQSRRQAIRQLDVLILDGEGRIRADYQVIPG